MPCMRAISKSQIHSKIIEWLADIMTRLKHGKDKNSHKKLAKFVMSTQIILSHLLNPIFS